MIKKIVKGYGQLIRSILQILFLLVLCVACGAVVVLPLWKFATVSPAAYSFTFIAVIALLAVFFAAKKIKSAGAKKTLVFCAKFLVIAGGLFSIFALVIFRLKILALPVLLLMIFLYGILSFKTKN